MDSRCVGFVAGWQWAWRCQRCINTKAQRAGFFSPRGAPALTGPGPLHYRDFTITFRHTTLGRTPLDEWSAWRGDYLTTHNIRKRQTSIPTAGFGPAIPASERPQTHALDRAATGIGQPDGFDTPSLSTIMNKLNFSILPESCLNSRHSVQKQIRVLHWTHCWWQIDGVCCLLSTTDHLLPSPRQLTWQLTD
jgi:hypothetical protein